MSDWVSLYRSCLNAVSMLWVGLRMGERLKTLHALNGNGIGLAWCSSLLLHVGPVSSNFFFIVLILSSMVFFVFLVLDLIKMKLTLDL